MNKRIWIETVRKTLYGIGCIKELGTRLSEMGLNRVLLVMDRDLALGDIRGEIEDLLRSSSVDFLEYLEVTPEPAPELADQGALLARKEGVKAVLGVGGGSTLDTAKAISVLVTNHGKARDYIGLGLVKRPGIPSVLVPTTAGTGSEATFTAVFTMREERKKGGINSPFLYPELAILDPGLTRTVPPLVTAYTGMDALTHAIESYTSKTAHFLSRTISREAIWVIADSLRGAVYNGEDMHKRARMLQGSYLAGLGLAMAGVGLVHAMAYPLGSFFDIPHGLANSVMLPYVLSYNYPAATEEYAEISYALEEDSDNLREAASYLPERILELLEDIGLPTSLEELKIPKDMIGEMAEVALGVTRPIQNNPRPVTKEDLIQVYESAFGS